MSKRHGRDLVEICRKPPCRTSRIAAQATEARHLRYFVSRGPLALIMRFVLKSGTMVRVMSQVTLARLCAVLLMTCVGCADAERTVADSGPARSDAGPSSAHATGPVLVAPSPATTVAAEVDLPFLVIATILEMERSLIARCPCLTAAREYDSASECLRAVSLGRHWIDCANRVDFSGHDSEEMRENLRCNIAELSLRSECLMGSSCTSDAIATCMTQSLSCGVLPYELISNVVSECKITLSR